MKSYFLRILAAIPLFTVSLLVQSKPLSATLFGNSDLGPDIGHNFVVTKERGLKRSGTTPTGTCDTRFIIAVSAGTSFTRIRIGYMPEGSRKPEIIYRGKLPNKNNYVDNKPLALIKKLISVGLSELIKKQIYGQNLCYDLGLAMQIENILTDDARDLLFSLAKDTKSRDIDHFSYLEAAWLGTFDTYETKGQGILISAGGLDDLEILGLTTNREINFASSTGTYLKERLYEKGYLGWFNRSGSLVSEKDTLSPDEQAQNISDFIDLMVNARPYLQGLPIVLYDAKEFSGNPNHSEDSEPEYYREVFDYLKIIKVVKEKSDAALDGVLIKMARKRNPALL
ncbi:hypothetical protein NX722_15925 [Endozoicomonas gorgoniicola]|uniref:Uncharacterized protein n=1 Tax=Endozoicomonas gorgoniicola TaxID=1234144 RepID=A0ABT3MXG2_9GAMM|nr:hypothetical protein [Endozoicomonas gorgoniicola]MCW7554078.1 hypothetical protein [Endozoicomonas gorgoniicola]